MSIDDSWKFGSNRKEAFREKFDHFYKIGWTSVRSKMNLCMLLMISEVFTQIAKKRFEKSSITSIRLAGLLCVLRWTYDRYWWFLKVSSKSQRSVSRKEKHELSKGRMRRTSSQIVDFWRMNAFYFGLFQQITLKSVPLLKRTVLSPAASLEMLITPCFFFWSEPPKILAGQWLHGVHAYARNLETWRQNPFREAI